MYSWPIGNKEIIAKLLNDKEATNQRFGTTTEQALLIQ